MRYAARHQTLKSYNALSAQTQDQAPVEFPSDEALVDALTTLITHNDEPSTIRFFTSFGLDRLLSCSASLRVDVLRALTTQASSRQEIWTPVLSVITHWETGDLRSHYGATTQQQVFWPIASQGGTGSVEAWLDQAQKWIRSKGTEYVLKTLAESGLSLEPWTKVLAQHAPTMTPNLVRLLELHPYHYPELLARTDFAAQDWHILLETHLRTLGTGSSTAPTPGTSLDGLFYWRYQHLAGHSSGRHSPQEIQRRALSAAGGMSSSLRLRLEQAIQSAAAPTTKDPYPTLAEVLLAEDQTTPPERFATWIDSQPDYGTKLHYARLLSGHHAYAMQSEVMLTSLLLDPAASGVVAPVPVKNQYSHNPLGEHGELYRTKLIQQALQTQAMPESILRKIAEVAIQPEPHNRQRNADLIIRVIESAAATPVIWAFIAANVDMLPVRVALASHPQAAKVTEVRAVLLRQRKADVLRPLMATASQEEFLLIWKRMVEGDPAAALTLLESGGLPYAVPRTGIAPILKSGDKELILRATKIMSALGDVDERYATMTRADALKATVAKLSQS